MTYLDPQENIFVSWYFRCELKAIFKRIIYKQRLTQENTAKSVTDFHFTMTVNVLSV